MAQSKVTTLHPAAVAKSEDMVLSDRYSDLEPEVVDLTRMTRLAEIQVNKAIGQLTCRDRNYIEAPDYEATDLALFTVSQMAKLVERFENLYFSAFAGGETK